MTRIRHLKCFPGSTWDKTSLRFSIPHFPFKWTLVAMVCLSTFTWNKRFRNYKIKSQQFLDTCKYTYFWLKGAILARKMESSLNQTWVPLIQITALTVIRSSSLHVLYIKLRVTGQFVPLQLRTILVSSYLLFCSVHTFWISHFVLFL